MIFEYLQKKVLTSQDCRVPTASAVMAMEFSLECLSLSPVSKEFLKDFSLLRLSLYSLG